METTEPILSQTPAGLLPGIKLKIFGVGGAGINMLEQIAQSCPLQAVLAAVNTDGRSLLSSTASEKICLEPKMMRGLGTGGDPERGRSAAEQNLSELKSACAGVDVVLIVSGLGGGAGTGISPVLAQAARESGALVLAFATLPFDCEGNRRQQQADDGLQELKGVADGVICLPNQKLFQLIDENTSVLDTFRLSNELIAEGVTSVSRLITSKGLIEIHFNDLCAFLRDRRGENYFATAEASGATRSREAIDKLLAHPMLDGGAALSGADAVLVSLTAGTDLTMAEINRVMEHINAKCAMAQVIMGATVDPLFQDRLSVTIVASRRTEPASVKSMIAEAEQPDGAANEQMFDTQLHRAQTPRPQSRFVPPPPTLTAEKMEQLASRQGGGTVRARKAAAKLRQTQLPLEIISKGRFDKSEPTIHKGEDLDVPTYIRRGIALN
jgi:cell division protein FtsZ